jgi:3-(3-hydroxy-phenyl)propionate hydroxylase
MGMNSGIHDAFNGCAKIARVLLDGEEAEPLLDQYTRQRHMVAVEYVQAASIRNKRLLEERDPAIRRERFDELRAIASDPDQAREYLRRSTLYESLERANAVA